jgi:hypothetical protein
VLGINQNERPFAATASLCRFDSAATHGALTARALLLSYIPSNNMNQFAMQAIFRAAKSEKSCKLFISAEYFAS